MTNALAEGVMSRLFALRKRVERAIVDGRFQEAEGLLLGEFPPLLSELETSAASETPKRAASWRQWRDDTRALVRQHEAWTARAATDLEACRSLLLALLEVEFSWDALYVEVTAPRVAVLLDAARALDQRAMALLGGHRLSVEVAPGTLTPQQRRDYGEAIALDLRGLGFDASTEPGRERFVVKVEVDGPHSMHYVDDTACECTVEAHATWEGSGLPPLDLTVHGAGDEEDDDCVDRALERSVKLAARRLVQAWASLPKE